MIAYPAQVGLAEALVAEQNNDESMILAHLKEVMSRFQLAYLSARYELARLPEHSNVRAAFPRAGKIVSHSPDVFDISEDHPPRDVVKNPDLSAVVLDAIINSRAFQLPFYELSLSPRDVVPMIKYILLEFDLQDNAQIDVLTFAIHKLNYKQKYILYWVLKNIYGTVRGISSSVQTQKFPMVDTLNNILTRFANTLDFVVTKFDELLDKNIIHEPTVRAQLRLCKPSLENVLRGLAVDYGKAYNSFPETDQIEFKLQLLTLMPSEQRQNLIRYALMEMIDFSELQDYGITLGLRPNFAILEHHFVHGDRNVRLLFAKKLKVDPLAHLSAFSPDSLNYESGSGNFSSIRDNAALRRQIYFFLVNTIASEPAYADGLSSQIINAVFQIITGNIQEELQQFSKMHQTIAEKNATIYALQSFYLAIVRLGQAISADKFDYGTLIAEIVASASTRLLAFLSFIDADNWDNIVVNEIVSIMENTSALEA